MGGRKLFCSFLQDRVLFSFVATPVVIEKPEEQATHDFREERVVIEKCQHQVQGRRGNLHSRSVST